MNTHPLPADLLERPVKIHLAGCGGNGSQVLTGLARLDRALRARGHPGGLQVVAFDPDTVSEANVGRQLFAPCDIGQSKAAVLVTRLNCFFGLAWEAVDDRWSPGRVQRDMDVPGLASIEAADILVTCVDTAKARREIHGALEKSLPRPRYWLDLGNEQESGQVVLGEPAGFGEPRAASSREFQRRGSRAKGETIRARLPVVTEVFPELLDPKRREDNRPSCSLAEALESQDLFVNQHVATWALQLLWTLFRKGRIRHHGAFVNLADGEVRPLLVPGPAMTEKRRKAA